MAVKRRELSESGGKNVFNTPIQGNGMMERIKGNVD